MKGEDIPAAGAIHAHAGLRQVSSVLILSKFLCLDQ